jgi:1,4-alpha-glucan branching enzyme
MNYPTLSEHVIEAIVGSYHGDPFSVLGPHAHDNGVVVRALLPYAATVSLIIPDDTIDMVKVHPQGLFETFLADDQLPLDYHFQLLTDIGDNLQLEDPYRFPPFLSNYDEHLLAEGTHLHIYEYLGAHLVEVDGRHGVRFAVWAPSALRASVVGDFNQWDGRRHPMRFHHNSGIWELFIPGLSEGTIYKYEIKTRYHGYTVNKTDPVGFASEMRPSNASVVWDTNKYEWADTEWVANRAQHNDFNTPISVYEVHLGSWRRKGDYGSEWLTYDELADTLIPYVIDMGFTHIELLPISEYPYDGSWGYQVTGYFAPTARFGNPDDFMAFVDRCHQAGIGVILDWVPAHFPKDQHGLSFFDGTHLYEHAHPLQREHPDWGTLIFNYGRQEVSQFLISNALFWLDKYHIDGLRVDAVASMIYLDFSREQGEWIPNRYGGRENIEAIEFIRRFNQHIHEKYPGALTIAEESTSWPGVTHSLADNGLGFDLKWNMGWMHDTLKYMSMDPVYRRHHHGTLTFSLMYAFSEKFMLPFSHDEVVHLKRNMLDKMPGDVWQRFANLRLLYGYQWSNPGKKLLFMGGEFGQWSEWSEARSLDWHLLNVDDKHRKLQDWVRTLNHFYASQPALYEHDFSWEGFQWLDLHDWERSLLAYARSSPASGETILVACNLTPVVRHEYWLPVPEPGSYQELLNSDATAYGGSNVINEGPMISTPIPWDEDRHVVKMTLPPLAIVFWKKLEESAA